MIVNLIRLFFLSQIILLVNPLFAETDKWKTCFQTHCITFRLPSNWYLTNRRSNGHSTKFDHFRTNSLKEESGREIIPAIVILFKESENKQIIDPILFHLESKKFTLITNIRDYYNLQKLSVVTDNDVYKFIGMVGTFKDKEDTIVQHYITSTEGEFGFTILITCFESVIPQIQKDIKLFLESLSYEKRNSPWKFVSLDDQIRKSKELETTAQSRLKTKQINEITLALEELGDSCDLGSISSCELFSNLMNVGR
ncbi:hypothetical protein EHQ43_04825 [Leptospira bouyouniensis]|uniref:Uncharacterized protein n=1 Tax=Leptospira bouyouniensis TaxID=2484911 RepID=A0A7I0HVL5_9LEPT|nr:hypothetical protein [Leptospira bouyouniensis]TGL08373.1 hypothetical protein EHQ43_04825 [Leptospira bouyouniensis]